MSSTLVYTPVDEIPKIRERLRGSFRAGKARSLQYRKEQLLQLAYMVQDNLELFLESLRKDLGRPEVETIMSDIAAVIAEVLTAYKGIDAWVKPDKAPFDFNVFLFSPKVHKEPKGTVLIISPFNYPLWCLCPITGAIAAGCAAVIKPSELTPATSRLLSELFPKYLDQEMYALVNGAIPETTKLLSLQWDHILYTGGGRVGRVVAEAAAKHLTPVTLELGGKSPVIIDENVDFDMAARRILWGRCVNAGQTCIAPDYVLVQNHVQDKLVEAFKVQLKDFYGDDPHSSTSFGRICASSHWDRINNILSKTKGKIVLGGETIKSEKYIAPTIVKDVPFNDSLMEDEIFGPVLPVVPVPNIDAALEYINNHDHPLSLYVFTKNSKFQSYVRENTLSGMFMANDTVMESASSVTPFGGVGSSGYGSHRGKYSFDTFVHQRASFTSPSWVDWILGIRYPPYNEKKKKKAISLLVPKIPYPRPGEKKGLNWKLWSGYFLVLSLILANRKYLAGLISH